MDIPFFCCIFVIGKGKYNRLKKQIMKTAKIILIVLYVLSILRNINKTLNEDGDDQFFMLIYTVIEGVVYGILYAYAGIFNV